MKISSLVKRLFSSRKINDSNVIRVGQGYSATSINTTIFRRSSLTTKDGFQFISFYDPKGRVVIGKRVIGKKKWLLKKTPFQANVKDAHNGISIGIDGDGFLHLAYGMHASPLKYARSIQPYSLCLQPLNEMDGKEEEKVTYPQFFSQPNGDLLFTYRSGKSGNGSMVLKKYSLATKNWETIHSNLIDGEGERNAYWQMCRDKKGSLHLSWVWRETPDVASNHDLCYAKSNDGGISWERSDGTQYELPITLANAEIIKVIPQNSELINQTSIEADDKGNPYIASYWRDQESNVPQFRVVWHDGTGWHDCQVGNRSTPFSLQGKGTKMVPISRPVILIDNKKVLYIFRDQERESKVSLATTENISSDKWLITDLTDFSVDAWEPTFDNDLWTEERILNLFLQETHQGDGEKLAGEKGESSEIYVMNVDVRE